jgi:hypothetical protein
MPTLSTLWRGRPDWAASRLSGGQPAAEVEPLELPEPLEPPEPPDEVDGDGVDDVDGVLAGFEPVSPLLELDPDAPELSLDPLLLDEPVLDESPDDEELDDDEPEPLRLSVL